MAVKLTLLCKMTSSMLSNITLPQQKIQMQKQAQLDTHGKHFSSVLLAQTVMLMWNC